MLIHEKNSTKTMAIVKETVMCYASYSGKKELKHLEKNFFLNFTILKKMFTFARK